MWRRRRREVSCGTALSGWLPEVNHFIAMISPSSNHVHTASLARQSHPAVPTYVPAGAITSAHRSCMSERTLVLRVTLLMINGTPGAQAAAHLCGLAERTELPDLDVGRSRPTCGCTCTAADLQHFRNDMMRLLCKYPAGLAAACLKLQRWGTAVTGIGFAIVPPCRKNPSSSLRYILCNVSRADATEEKQ